jgi:arginase
MRLTLFEVPYDSGHFGKRMGRGPQRLVERGLAAALERRGHQVEVVAVRLSEAFMTEAGAAAEIQRRLSGLVAAARAAGRFPLILSGNCNTAVGTLAGIELAAAASGAAESEVSKSSETGVLWLDAHGDLNTPETSLSGFFDGTALSIVTGAAWRALAGTVPGFRPVDERNVVLAGARDLDPAEAHRLERSAIAHLRPAACRDGSAALASALDALAARVSRIYLHVDLDVLDPSVARINQFAAPGGLTVEEVARLVAAAGRRFEIAAAALTAYDPDCDPDDGAAQAAEAVAAAVVGAAVVAVL